MWCAHGVAFAQDGMTPLMAACLNGHTNIATYLIEKWSVPLDTEDDVSALACWSEFMNPRMFTAL